MNFRNALLVLAISLQLLTYMKHEGASIVGLPATLPIGSPLVADEPAPSAQASTHLRAKETFAEASGSLASAELPRPAEGKPEETPDRPSSKRTVRTIAPKGFDGGSTGAPIAGGPRSSTPIPAIAQAPAPGPVAASNPTPEPAPSPTPAPGGTGNVNNPPPPPPPPPGVSTPPQPVEPPPDRPGGTADGPPPPRLEEPLILE